MKTYIALLRGINVSGQKKIKMVDLKAMFETIGCTSVQTYIQSGNIVFEYAEETNNILGQRIKEAILEHFGFEVPVLVLTPKKLIEIFENNPFSKRLGTLGFEDKKLYFTLLTNVPDPVAVSALEAADYGTEEFVITNEVVYFYAANGYGKTKLDNNFFERKLKSPATTRNLRTMTKLIELLPNTY
ncbi:DUF1697 domain-containing protein [Aquimarina pacifica]|uniref:DUF1697 domain-containing protein n=1 Tax=Aquimarina pacifica TaxID=1296415 RepID=UPI0004712853|nr:DUF1697 domain-containing protein [Aquimarina pacifica]